MTEAEKQSLAGALKTPAITAIRRKIGGFKTDEINAPGSFFYVKESSGPILIALDDGPALPWDVGTGLRAEPGAAFTRLTIQNPFSDEITVVVYIGRGEAIDNRFTLVPSRDFAIPVYESKTEIVGWNSNTLAANTTVPFLGVPTLPQIKRKSLIVSNLDPANPVYIKDAAGNFCAAVAFGTSGVFNVSGPVYVVNGTTSPIPVCISEIWVVR